MIKKIIPLLLGVLLLVVPVVSAQSYNSVFSPYVPVSGGAWCETDTAQGVVTFVVPRDYISDSFGFLGDGYSVSSVINSTINGTAYSQSQFSYYGNPIEVQCRFTRMNTLEVYAPYRNSYGNTSYQWESLPTTAVRNTNMNFVDDTGGNRQNDSYRYDTTQKVLILIFCTTVLLGAITIFRKAWKA